MGIGQVSYEEGDGESVCGYILVIIIFCVCVCVCGYGCISLLTSLVLSMSYQLGKEEMKSSGAKVDL